MSEAVAVIPPWAKGLDNREYAFVSHYLQEFNGSAAARAVGTPTKSAGPMACRWLQQTHIREAINLAMQEALPSIKLTLAERLAAVARTDIGDIMDWGRRRVNLNAGLTDKDGKPRKPRYADALRVSVRDRKKLDTAQRQAIKSIRKRVGLYGESVEVVMHDPLAAAEKFADFFGLRHNPETTKTGGQITFIIETPDGAVIREKPSAIGIDRNAIDAAIKANVEPDKDELPPGAKAFVVEPP